MLGNSLQRLWRIGGEGGGGVREGGGGEGGGGVGGGGGKGGERGTRRKMDMEGEETFPGLLLHGGLVHFRLFSDSIPQCLLPLLLQLGQGARGLHWHLADP